MATGQTIQELAQALSDTAHARRDYIAQENALRMLPETGQLQIGNERAVDLNGVAHEQLAGKLSIPLTYYRRMLDEAPELLARNANEWLERSEKKRMVRTLEWGADKGGPVARAYLGNGYRPLENDELLPAIVGAANDSGDPTLTVNSCAVTERRMYVKLVSERLRGEVKRGDVVQYGLCIGNSEVGLGSLYVDAYLMRLVCTNGMIGKRLFRKAHLGGQHALDADAERYLRDETRELRDKALFAELRDTVRGMLTETAMEAALAPLRAATERVVEGNPAESVQVLKQKLSLTEEEAGGCLRHLIAGGDVSAWGLANAVTSLAHDADTYDRAVELERAGQRVIELSPRDWKEVATA